jgi:hypothetical protein
MVYGLLMQSRECLEKVAKTVSFLAQPEGSFLLLLTGNWDMYTDKIQLLHPFFPA